MVRHALLLAILATVCGCYSNSAAPFLDAGNAAIASSDWEQAIEQFNEALRVDPNSRGALKGRGVAYEKMGQFALAIADYELLLGLDDDNVEIRQKLVLLCIELEDPDRAQEPLSKLQGKIGDAEFFLIQGRLGLLQNDAKQALQGFERAVSLDSKSAAAWYFHGIALGRLGRHAEADRSFSSAIASDNRFAAAFWRRSRARLNLGQTELAELDQRRAAELDPRMTFAESSAGESALETLRGSESLQPLERPNP